MTHLQVLREVLCPQYTKYVKHGRERFTRSALHERQRSQIVAHKALILSRIIDYLAS